MKFNKETADLYIPLGGTEEDALKQTTHMAIAAHQDDIEIMAYHGVVECFGKSGKGFLGVVVTNGSGSPRDDLYASYTDEEMMKVRRVEQKKAAFVGEYTAQGLLDFTSSEVKNGSNRQVVEDIKKLIDAARPKVVYTHNLADKHDTHVAVAMRVIQAIRELPEEAQPEVVYGCEVWRGLDWLIDDDKVLFDVQAHENLAAALLGVFDSQICGGKRYDLAIQGRRRANATFYASHGTDDTTGLNFAMDLTPVVKDPKIDLRDYVLDYITRFASEVSGRIEKLG